MFGKKGTYHSLSPSNEPNHKASKRILISTLIILVALLAATLVIMKTIKTSQPVGETFIGIESRVGAFETKAVETQVGDQPVGETFIGIESRVGAFETKAGETQVGGTCNDINVISALAAKYTGTVEGLPEGQTCSDVLFHELTHLNVLDTEHECNCLVSAKLSEVNAITNGCTFPLKYDGNDVDATMDELFAYCAAYFPKQSESASVEAAVGGKYETQGSDDVKECFAEHMEVETFEGTKALSELRVGEKIKTCSNSWTTVYMNVNHRKGTYVFMQELVFENENLVLSANHLLKVDNKFIPARDVTPGMEIHSKQVLDVRPGGNFLTRIPITGDHEILVNGVCATWLVEELDFAVPYMGYVKLVEDFLAQWLPTWYIQLTFGYVDALYNWWINDFRTDVRIGSEGPACILWFGLIFGPILLPYILTVYVVKKLN